MTLQVLVSTMNQTDFSLLEKMNIQSDAIVVNQCDRNEIEEFNYGEYKIKWVSLNERGIGLSRNTALMRATADIVLFADDDVIYKDGYETMIINEFNNNPKCSLITFNLESQNKDRPEYIVSNTKKIYLFNCLRYGAARIAIKRNVLFHNNIFFSLLFGGGALYTSGEDNIFIVQCLKSGMKGVASQNFIGTVKQETSSWFNGYNEKYYFDRAILIKTMYGILAKPFLFILNKRHRPNELFEIKEKKKSSKKGIKQYNIMRKY